MRCLRAFALVATAAAAACSSVQSVRVQPDAVHAGDGLRPVAAIQADALSAYVLFVPIPGVDLDRVVNRMLVATAKTMGADMVTDLEFHVTPESGVWALRKLLGWRSAEASGIAVQVEVPPGDPSADDGPEPPGQGGVGEPEPPQGDSAAPEARD